MANILTRPVLSVLVTAMDGMGARSVCTHVVIICPQPPLLATAAHPLSSLSSHGFLKSDSP